jgi:hypothetical protein
MRCRQPDRPVRMSPLFLKLRSSFPHGLDPLRLLGYLNNVTSYQLTERMTVVVRKYQSFDLVLTMVMMLTVLGQGPILQGTTLLCASPQPRSVVPGSHCPLTYPSPSRSKSPPHHCSMYQMTMQRRCELHCACCHHPASSSPESTSIRFVLPRAVSPFSPTSGVLQYRESPVFFPEIFVVPPDPPPRHLLVSI